jgi:beta-lactam-binding protein with PASTA domain
VRGQTLATAVSGLQAAHCAPGAITRVFSSTVRLGNVVSQLIPAGAQLADGAAVDLVVSKGRAPKKPPVRVTLCYRHHTIKVTKAKAKKLRKHGAKLGACKKKR